MFQSLKLAENTHIHQLFEDGQFRLLHAAGDLVLFTRSANELMALVAINTGPSQQTVTVSLDDSSMLDELNGLSQLVPDSSGAVAVDMEGHSVRIFHNTCYYV